MGKFRKFFDFVIDKIRYYTSGRADGYEKIARVFDHFDKMLVALAEGRDDLIAVITTDTELVDDLKAKIGDDQAFLDKARTVAHRLEAILAETDGDE